MTYIGQVQTDFCLLHKRLLWATRIEELLYFAERDATPWTPKKFGAWDSYEYKNLDPAGKFGSDLKTCSALLPSAAKQWRVLRLKPGTSVPTHQDTAEKPVHSLNLLLRPPSMGGVLKIKFKEIYLTPGDAVVYNATKELHSISTPQHGTLYLLSIQTGESD